MDTPTIEPYEVGEGGMTRPLFDFAEAIREFVYVEMPRDTDGDGANDLVRVDIMRPRELDGVARVPAILEPSPYYGTFKRHGEDKEYERPELKAESRLSLFPWWLDNVFVPCGYAVLLPETCGTNLSQGFCDIGGPNDTASLKAIVDWLNGRARAFWTRDDRSEANLARADWASGAVGAIGKSYDGSVCNALAATGVEGLKTIVPISAISDQYQWYHPYGALLDGDDDDGGWWEPGPFAEFLESPLESKVRRMDTGGHYQAMVEGADKQRRCYTGFWGERNYVKAAPRFKASVFLVHGVNDLNVMMNQVGPFWKALADAGVPRKIWLSRYGHDDPFDFRRDMWVRTLHRWFDHWLLGVDNGIMDEPAASIEGRDGEWRDEADWPAPGARGVRFAVAPWPDDGTDGSDKSGGSDGSDDAGKSDGAAGDHPGDGRLTPCGGVGLSADGSDGADGADAADGAPVLTIHGERVSELATLEEGDHGRKPGRLLFVGDPLEHDLRLSGAATLTLEVRSSEPDTNLACMLIEYGEGLYVEPDPELNALIKLKDTTVIGAKGPNDKSEHTLYAPRAVNASAHVVTRGWIGLPHRNSWEAYEPMPTGGFATVTVPLLPTDWTVRAGHRLALAIANTTTRLAAVPLADLKVRAGSVALDLPLVG